MANEPTTPSPIRVLLVDDHPMVRQGIQALLDGEDDMEVCGEAESVAAALEFLEAHEADVAVIDLALKESSGLDLIKELKARTPEVHSLVLTMKEGSFYSERALRAGARGFINKEAGPKQIREGLRTVATGRVYLGSDLARTLVDQLIGGEPLVEGLPLQRLTDRELEVFELLGDGTPVRDIAARLDISPKTVDSYRERLKDKLGVASAPELLKHAILWVHDRSPE